MIEEHNTIRTYIDGRGNKYKYCNPVFCNYPKKRKIVIKKYYLKTQMIGIRIRSQNLIILTLMEQMNV